MGNAISPRGDTPKYRAISVEKLARLVGTPQCSVLVDVRTDEDFKADPRLVPGATRRPHSDVSDWAGEVAGRSAVVVCQKGGKLSEGVAALLRHGGVSADFLEDGFLAWKKAALPLVPTARMPKVDRHGRTVWVTRARPKVDRIACPWLIRRFVDPRAVFLLVTPAEVEGGRPR
jgi:rhodanese-related sulfurtransferase